jgi:hypothetical protein
MDMDGALSASVHKGRCACGDVRYRLTAHPLFVHACHCRECQRLSGGAFALNALIENECVELVQGRPEPVPVIGASGNPQTIFRCGACRIALWSHYPGAGPAICFVRVGTLEQPQVLPPDLHIFTESRLPWLELPPGAPSVPAFYSIQERWPPESLRRLALLKARAQQASD